MFDLVYFVFGMKGDDRELKSFSTRRLRPFVDGTEVGMSDAVVVRTGRGSDIFFGQKRICWRVALGGRAAQIFVMFESEATIRVGPRAFVEKEVGEVCPSPLVLLVRSLDSLNRQFGRNTGSLKLGKDLELTRSVKTMPKCIVDATVRTTVLALVLGYGPGNNNPPTDVCHLSLVGLVYSFLLWTIQSVTLLCLETGPLFHCQLPLKYLVESFYSEHEQRDPVPRSKAKMGSIESIRIIGSQPDT